MGKESEKEWRLYIYDSLCCTPETNNIVNQLYSNKNLKKEMKKLQLTPQKHKRSEKTTLSNYTLIKCTA